MNTKEQSIEPPGCGQRPVFITAAKENTLRQDLLDSLLCREEVGRALSSEGYFVYNLDIFQADMAHPKHLIEHLKNANPLCIFNLFEGFGSAPWLEATFCELLEKNHIPYTGNPSSALRLCIDKFALQSQLKKEGIPVPLTYYLQTREDIAKIHELRFPLFIKPRSEDGSVGIDSKSLVRNEKELQESVEEKLEMFPKGILAQEFLSGSEYSVSFIGNAPFKTIALWTLDYSRYPNVPAYLSYDAKWDEESPEWNLWPEHVDLSGSIKQNILAMASSAAEVAGCKGYFRVDIREHNGNFFVIDINPNPALTRDSGLARQYVKNGGTYEQLVSEILQLAIENSEKRSGHE
ncbi:MAG: ATP-grasp domain-containing protein [Aminobacterium sp.]|nr:ATP-grasp domain-containing protein [Aminobacterium sp.]